MIFQWTNSTSTLPACPPVLSSSPLSSPLTQTATAGCLGGGSTETRSPSLPANTGRSCPSWRASSVSRASSPPWQAETLTWLTHSPWTSLSSVLEQVQTRWVRLRLSRISLYCPLTVRMSARLTAGPPWSAGPPLAAGRWWGCSPGRSTATAVPGSSSVLPVWRTGSTQCSNSPHTSLTLWLSPLIFQNISRLMKTSFETTITIWLYEETLYCE